MAVFCFVRVCLDFVGGTGSREGDLGSVGTVRDRGQEVSARDGNEERRLGE
jgi:hypothetical protein